MTMFLASNKHGTGRLYFFCGSFHDRRTVEHPQVLIAIHNFRIVTSFLLTDSFFTALVVDFCYSLTFTLVRQ